MLTVDWTTDSLRDVLARLGWRYESGGRATGSGRNVVFNAAGENLGTFTANELWCELHATGLIRFEDGVSPRGYRRNGEYYGEALS